MIIYFSGTGNTAHCALRLAELLDSESVHELSPLELTDPASTTLPFGSKEDRVVWAFPIYSWGLPPVVAEYIKKVRIPADLADVPHYMLCTCGDDVGDTVNQWRKLMMQRGFTTAGAWSVVMPNTYVCMKGFNVDTPELARKKVAESEDRLIEIAEAIASGEGCEDIVKGKFPWMKSHVIYPLFSRFATSAKPFRSNGGCTGCGLCSRRCPMANIVMKDRRPEWSDNCAMCLRCYHICPHHAVAYGKATDGKGQYLYNRMFGKR